MLLMWWHNSRLMWHSNMRQRIGQNGTTHSLVISISSAPHLFVHVCPPSSGERRLYRGYPSFPLRVSRQKAFGKSFVQRPFAMQTQFGLSAPHGPCIMFLVTISCKRGSVSLSGISAEIMESISSSLIRSAVQSNRCK